MIPWRRPDELLHDQTFHIDQGRNLLGILAVQVGQQALQGEVHIALTCRGLQTLLVGLGEVMQAVNHVVEDVGGNDAIVQQFRLSLCPDDSHLFASLRWHAKRGCSLEAIDITMSYITQEGWLEKHTVSLSVGWRYTTELWRSTGDARWTSPPGVSGDRQAGGATVRPRTLCLAIVRATSPVALTSSMKAHRYRAPAGRPFGMPAAC